MCSGDIVFFCCLLQISLASDDNKCINSVQQFSISSLESLAILIFGTNSLIILFRAALGMFNSSSSFPPSAIVQGTSWNRKETALKTIARFFCFVLKKWENPWAKTQDSRSGALALRSCVFLLSITEWERKQSHWPIIKRNPTEAPMIWSLDQGACTTF